MRSVADAYGVSRPVLSNTVQEMVETADLGLIMGTSLKVNPFKQWVDCVGIPMVGVENVEKWRSGEVCVPVMRTYITYPF